MHDLDLTTLRLFVTVCETESLTRAAALGNIVPSAISKRMAQLEAVVGTPVLVRRQRGLQPTPAGETLLQHARGMLAGAQRLAMDMQSYGRGIKGNVRVLATASMMMESLAGDVAAFLRLPAHADIQVNMEEHVSSEVLRGLKEGSASLGFCWDVTDLRGLQSRTYLHDHLAVVVHPAHPLAKARTLRFEQTLDHPHASLPAGSAIQAMLQREAMAAGKPLVSRVVVSTPDSQLRVVHAGLAVAVMPREVTQPVAGAFGLRVIPLTDKWAKRRFVVCFVNEKTLSPAARSLLEHLSGGKYGT